MHAEPTHRILLVEDNPADAELTAEFHESVQHLKETTTPDYKSLAMEIYTSTEDGMEKRAIRRLQQVKGERGEKEFREKAFHVYRTDYAKEEFGDAAQDLNADDYLWQREPGTGASEFAKREEEKNLFGYRSKRMQQPPSSIRARSTQFGMWEFSKFEKRSQMVSIVMGNRLSTTFKILKLLLTLHSVTERS